MHQSFECLQFHCLARSANCLHPGIYCFAVAWITKALKPKELAGTLSKTLRSHQLQHLQLLYRQGLKRGGALCLCALLNQLSSSFRDISRCTASCWRSHAMIESLCHKGSKEGNRPKTQFAWSLPKCQNLCSRILWSNLVNLHLKQVDVSTKGTTQSL